MSESLKLERQKKKSFSKETDHWMDRERLTHNSYPAPSRQLMQTQLPLYIFDLWHIYDAGVGLVQAFWVPMPILIPPAVLCPLVIHHSRISVGTALLNKELNKF
jgi:hypothetical protein